MVDGGIQYYKTLVMAMVVLGSVTLSGCVFYSYSSPRIDGVITRHGQAQAGLKVALIDFGQTVQTTQSDSQGRFSFAGQGEWSVFIPIGAQDRITRWSVVIEQHGREITGYEAGGIGGPFSGYSGSDHMMLSCDMSLAKENANAADASPVCRLSANR